MKVPVTPYSVLTETLHAQVQPVPSTSANSKSFENNNKPKSGEFALNCNEVVLNSNLSPAVIPYTDADTNETIDEDTKLLPTNEKEPVETVVVKEFTSHGADFGINWFHLVCCLLLLGVIIPLVYVIFYVDKHEHHMEPSDIPPLGSP